MIVVETLDDVAALLQPLLETGSVRIITGGKSMVLPQDAEFKAMPPQTREFLVASKNATLRLVPSAGFPPVTISFRTSFTV